MPNKAIRGDGKGNFRVKIAIQQPNLLAVT